MYHLFCNVLFHVIYFVVSGQYSYTIQQHKTTITNKLTQAVDTIEYKNRSTSSRCKFVLCKSDNISLEDLIGGVDILVNIKAYMESVQANPTVHPINVR